VRVSSLLHALGLTGRQVYPEAAGRTMNCDELLASIEAMRPGRDDIVYLQGLGYILTDRRVP
jgi:hypothetical protein